MASTLLRIAPLPPRVVTAQIQKKYRRSRDLRAETKKKLHYEQRWHWFKKKYILNSPFDRYLVEARLWDDEVTAAVMHQQCRRQNSRV